MQSVPANAQIDLQNCEGDWCSASWRNLSGYIPSFAVAEAGGSPPVVAPPPPVVVEAPIYAAPAFRWGGPYVGFGWGYGWRRW